MRVRVRASLPGLRVRARAWARASLPGLRVRARARARVSLPGPKVPSEPAGVSARLEHSENSRAAASKVVSPASIFVLIASAATVRASMSPPFRRMCWAATAGGMAAGELLHCAEAEVRQGWRLGAKDWHWALEAEG